MENQTVSSTKSSNPILSIILGLALGIVGAAIWALITKVTGYNLGIIAIVVGFLVAFGFRLGGLTSNMTMGIIAAVIAFFSVLLGNVFTIFMQVADYFDVSLLEVVQLFDYAKLPEVILESSSPIDLLFYFIALSTAFKGSYISGPKVNNVTFDRNVGTPTLNHTADTTVAGAAPTETQDSTASSHATTTVHQPTPASPINTQTSPNNYETGSKINDTVTEIKE